MIGSIAFQEAVKLSQLNPLPEDIITRLDGLSEEIFPIEEFDMAFIYEGVQIEISKESD